MGGWRGRAGRVEAEAKQEDVLKKTSRLESLLLADG